MGNIPEYTLSNLSNAFYILLKYKRHSDNNQVAFNLKRSPTTSHNLYLGAGYLLYRKPFHFHL